MKKVVVFNALQTSLSAGIGRYSFELAREIYSQNKEATDQNSLDIKIVIREEDTAVFDFVSSDDLHIVHGIQTTKQRNAYEQFKLPKYVIEKYPQALLHYPDTMAPIFAKNNVVITVHDLAFKSLKKVFTFKTRMWKNLITNLSIKKAKSIIAITKFTKSEVLQHYPKLHSEKVNVIYNGFNDFSSYEPNMERVSDVVRSAKNYILTVSTISPRKNIDGLIRAFYTIKDLISQNLVIAGNNGWMYESVHKLVVELGLQDRVIFTGKVNDDELAYLYKNTDLLVYVSFYEGFGLPPLEAMSCGKPCIVSDTSSLPEVVGQCATQVTPTDTADIAEAILTVIKSRHEERSAEYNKWLQNFSWKKCGKQVLALYNSLFAGEAL